MDEDVLSRLPPKADYRVKYGPEELQFGDLWLPDVGGRSKAPLVVFVHGGWWQAEYGLAYGGHLCAALKTAGLAVWSIEYRRVGDAGGGWPGTFEDVARGYDFSAELAKRYPLDLARVVVVGHSAGGHLAFWLAGRHHLLENGPLVGARVSPVPMRAVVALAGVVGLQMTIDLSGWFTFAHDKGEVYTLMGGTPKQVPERYRAGDPEQLLPLNVRQVLLQGTEDGQIPPGLPARWAEKARRMGEEVTVTMIEGAGHFDLVDPESAVWGRVMAAILSAGQ